MSRKRCLIAVMLVVVTSSAAWTYYRETRPGEDMAVAAREFIATLSADQKRSALMDYASPQRVDWHFIPKPERKGLQVKHMTSAQQEAAHKLLQTALSQVGYQKATKIMDLERLLHELEAGRGQNLRDPHRYYFTLFGEPGEAGRWGLSVEGHHLSLNFVVDAGKVVSSTPQVFCANPAQVKGQNTSGIAVGTRLLAKEEQLAFDLVKSLDDGQRAKAVIGATPLKEVRDAGKPQPPQDPPVGISAGGLKPDQQKLLRDLLDVYATALPQSVARERMAAIEAEGFDKVHFAWAGATEPGIGHYYRVQGPTFVLEFVNTQPDAAGNVANHIHTVWRDMRGDFGLPVR